MYSITVVILHALIAWSHAKALVVNQTSDVQDAMVKLSDRLADKLVDRVHGSVSKLVDEMFNRVLEVSKFHSDDLENTTLGKPGHLAQTNLRPALHRPPSPFHTNSPFVPQVRVPGDRLQSQRTRVATTPSRDIKVVPKHEDKAPMFSVQEVARHSTPQDCWVIVKDKVYDVSPYVSKHPGGPLIAVKAGGDCTQLFKAYHLNNVAENTLNKYYKGNLDVASIVSPLVRYQGEEHGDTKSGNDEEFYRVLKQRVGRYFKDNNKDPTWHPEMLAKSIAILGTLGVGYYAAFWLTGVPFLVSFLGSLVYGFAAAQCGMSIMHDANHGSYTKNEPFKALMSFSLDLVGASSFMWRQQHVVGHHCFTNVDGRDPDIRVEDPDPRKFAPQQPTRWWHKFQRFYLPPLYGAMTALAIYAGDFVNLATGKMGDGVKLAEMTTAEKAVFWGFKALYMTYMWVIPLMFGPHGLAGVIALHMGLNFVNGFTLATIFQVAHVTDDVEYPQEQKDSGKVNMGWAESQVRTAADFCVDSRFWMHMTGGLSHQIEHHLFPGMCHVHYLDIAPIVEKTCKDFNIPYVKYPTFKSAVEGHWRALDKFGNPKDALAAATSEMPR